MDLNEYIKMSYKRPNRKVLEGLGASEDLIEYLMETPGNTNWNVIGSITSPGGDTGEVWLVGEVLDGFAQLYNNGDTNYTKELYDNAENYRVFLNDEELPYFEENGGAKEWKDIGGGSYSKIVSILLFDGEYMAKAEYMDVSTAPTSVEVSVKEITE